MDELGSANCLIDENESAKLTFRLGFSSLVASIGAFQFGWNTGVINNPQMAIIKFTNNTLLARYGYANMDTVKAILATIVAIFAAGGLIGALIAGWLGDKLGRRNGMMISNLIMVIAGGFMLISAYARSFEMIIIGRFLSGCSSGLFTGLVPVYLNEISPVKIRGSIGLLMQFGVVCGLFLSQVLGLSEIMGNDVFWNALLGLVIVFSVVQSILLQFCPNSPKYLLYFLLDEVGAEKALKILRPPGANIAAELETMKREVYQDKDVEKVNLFGILRDRALRMALFVGIVLHLSQQFSGINNIFYYSSTLFESVGVDKSKSQYATLGVGLMMFVITAVSIPLIEKLGRRTLHIGGLTGCLLTSIAFTIFYSFADRVPALDYLSIISALLFVASFGIGPGSIPWMIIPELFREGTRSTATSIGISVNWLSNLIVGLIFPYLLAGLRNLIFIPFIVCHVLCIVFLCFFMPETKGLTSEESAQLFSETTHRKSNVERESSATSF